MREMTELGLPGTFRRGIAGSRRATASTRAGALRRGAGIPRSERCGSSRRPNRTTTTGWPAAWSRSSTFAFGPEPTSYIEPLYPAFLASGMFLFGSDRLVHAPAGNRQRVGSAGAVSARLAADDGIRSAGAWAAMLYAADPYLVRQAHSYIEVPFAVPLLLWTLERLAGGTPHGSGGRCRSADVASCC